MKRDKKFKYNSFFAAAICNSLAAEQIYSEPLQRISYKKEKYHSHNNSYSKIS